MAEFQFYKKRDFVSYLGDTLNFFKLFWKNYLTNYLAINGVVLLLFGTLYFILYKDSFANLFNPLNASHAQFFSSDKSIGLFIVLIIALFVVALALSILTNAFPLVYVNQLDNTPGNEIQASDILNGIKGKLGRILLFALISLFTITPLILIGLAIEIALCFVLIGIPLLIISLPAVMIWALQSFIVYVEEPETGYFEALKRGWDILFSNFWHIVGSTIVLYLCISIVSSMFSVIPMFAMLFSTLSSGHQPGSMSMSPFIILVYVIGIIFTYIMYNLIYMQQILIYYGSLEEEEDHQAMAEIESIGNNEE